MWQSIDTAPHDETPVMLMCRDAQVRAFWSIKYRHWYEDESASHDVESMYGPATHWKPIED